MSKEKRKKEEGDEEDGEFMGCTCQKSRKGKEKKERKRRGTVRANGLRADGQVLNRMSDDRLNENENE